ncbi:MAG: twin-arginine translocase subunit TatC [Patescibacteria group bacterium]
MPEEGLDGAIDKYLPFLDEIRKRLRLLVFLFLGFSILGFVYYEPIITFSIRIFRLEGVNIAFTSPFQFINLAFSSGLAVGLIGTLPVVLYQVFSFLRPGLKKREYRLIMTLVPLAILLFAIGFFYGVGVMKYVIGLFYQKSTELEIANLLDISALLSQIIVTSSMLGAAFEFPVILSTLMKLKFLNYRTVASQRTVVYFICLVFASLLPPTDLLSLALLTLPLIFLFESTLLVNRILLGVRP